ncbi:MAG: hypothetical protein H7Y38_19065 [Armatimonadetes bacterium]|nr:hypothetical protein [Armatimonadota bacterium]
MQFLEQLRRTGSLSDSEIEQAKATLTAKYSQPPGSSATPAERRKRRNRLENERSQIERNWRIKSERLKAHDKYGREYIPTKAGGVFGGIALAAGGVFVATQTGRWEIGVPLGLVLLTVAGVAGWGMWLKAQAYEDAEAQYKRDMMGLRDDLRQVDSASRR